MKQIKIEGGHKLNGTIKICGAKNSAVALIPAAILSDEVVRIDNIPNVSDIDALVEILEYLGANITREIDSLVIDSSNIENKEIPEILSKKLRASYYFMGALLGRYKSAEIYFPGGCSIGARPINLHLKGFEYLGVKTIQDNNKFILKADELRGSRIYLDIASVGATINLMFAAVKANGITVIENAAKEPEIVNVATFLNNMGAKISGAGTSTIMIKGVDRLGSGFTEVIPDRIEAGTYILAGALMGENLKIENIIPSHIESLTSKLTEMNVDMDIGDDYVTVYSSNNIIASNIKTLSYPGYPTDLQQPITTLFTQSHGKSTVEETIYENRFLNVKYLCDMGADISINCDKLTINGPTKLIGKEVIATDLRAGACLILAGLVAEGTTIIKEVEHILRGYEDIVGKLNNVGAKLSIEEY
ncbi:MAG: UDP-N-acetylglucosamine 1-carboxyvinyltransferase [Clostridium sp.]|nr:UDP-N-acetylglucosamine 1-carboxyvinyltransferase [Clostridium sp.]MCM1443702.1 UDP-N-acetylglucosamine 1-carboxyvinyltransferase [Candidatus Amulumruptor caecigallinarius]